ncbi:MAG: thiol-disulfide oxidoreductase DCC family protein [Planctomycetaceae bacterium]
MIYFDGVCGLCNRSIDFVLPRDRDKIFRFSPLQGETARKQLKPSDTERLGSIILQEGKQVYRHSTAVVRILRKLGGVWAFLAVLLWVIPWPVRHVGYKIVAACRYRLFGKKETCRMPTPEERERFLP